MNSPSGEFELIKLKKIKHIYLSIKKLTVDSAGAD